MDEDLEEEVEGSAEKGFDNREYEPGT